jgi:hypothetical protein
MGFLFCRKEEWISNVSCNRIYYNVPLYTMKGIAGSGGE